MNSAADVVRGGEGLLGLHELLRAARFVVGPRELLAATQLAVRLHETGQMPEKAEDLLPLLRAVYCKSAAEQKRFGGVFEQWLATRVTAPEKSAATQKIAGPLVSEPKPDAKWMRWIRTALFWLFCAFVVYQAWQRTPSTDAPKADKPVADAPDTVPGGGAPTAPVAPTLAFDPSETGAGMTGYVPVQRVQREFRPWVVWLLLGLPLPLLVLLYAPALVLSRRHGERSRQSGRVHLDISDWRIEAERLVPALNPLTAGRLDRHVRPPADVVVPAGHAVLDPQRTLAETLRRHAFTLRWRPRRVRPSYLMLVDISGEQDLRGRLFFRWADRLRSQGVAVDIWLFDRDPRTLFPAERRRVLDEAGRERNAVRFEHVAGRAVEELVHRLVIVSDGAGFFAQGAELHEWWTTMGWERWPQRVLFTPVDSRDWGAREIAIERRLSRGDPRFLVLPLEQQALDAYAVFLTRGTLPLIVLENAGRLPPVIARLLQRGLSPTKPPDEDVETLMRQLRAYLGDNGLRWLAACAVPPVTRWELTLLIGQALFRELGADSEARLSWLMSSNYPLLARLPWLREANIPDWLALRLLHELTPAMQERVREVVRTLLQSIPTEQEIATGDVLILDCAPPVGSGIRAPDRPASDASARDAEEREKRERRQWLYLGFLDGLSPRQLAMRAPARWRDFFAHSGALSVRGGGMRRLVQIAVDWVRALAARMMWHDGQASSGAASLPWIAALSWSAGVAIVLTFMSTRPVDRLPPAVDQALFVDSSIGVGDVSELPFRALSFSGDGSRFVLAEANGEVRVMRTETAAGTPRTAGPLIRVADGLAGAHLNRNGSEVITISQRGVVTRWDVDTGARKSELGRLTFEFIEFSPIVLTAIDAKFVVVKRKDGSVESLVLTDEGKTQPSFFELGPSYFELGDSLEQLAIAITDLDGYAITLSTIRSAGAAGETEVFVFVHDPFRRRGYAVTLPPKTVSRAWLSNDGLRVAVATDGARSLQVFDLTPMLMRPPEAGEPRRQFPPGTGVLEVRVPSPIVSVRMGGSPVRRVAAVLANGEVHLFGFDRVRPQQGVIPAAGASSAPPEIFLAPNGGLLLVREGKELVAYDLDRAEMLHAAATSRRGVPPGLPQFVPVGAPLASDQPVGAVAFSPPGDHLLTATTNHEARLWETARLRTESQVAPTPSSAQRIVAVSDNGQISASAGADGRITVWSTTTGAFDTPFAHPPQSAVHALALTADGALLASGGSDGSVRLWDVRQRKRLGEVSHGAELTGLRFDAEGQYILSVGAGVARLWRPGETGPLPAATLGARNVVSARFVPDGQSVVTASGDGLVQRWSVATGAPTAALRVDDADTSINAVRRVTVSTPVPAPTSLKISALQLVRFASTERVPSAAMFDGLLAEATQVAQSAPAGAQQQLRSATAEPPPTFPSDRAGRPIAPKWVDDLVGMPLKEATEAIRAQGFVVGAVRYVPSKASDGTVQTARPKGFRTVDLHVAGDAQRVEVPDLKRTKIEDARGALRDRGLAIGSVQYTVSRALPGTVLSSRPDAGTAVAPGTRVSLTVSGAPSDEAEGKAPRKGDATQAGTTSVRCREGWVAREAFTGDSVCTSPAVRDQVTRDNREVATRVDPINRAFGAETCRSGFVWREADRYLRGDRFTDKVCVTPEQRDQAAADNLRRGERADTASIAVDARQQIATALRDVYVDEDAPWLIVSGRHVRQLDGTTLQPVGTTITHENLTQARFLPLHALVATASLDGQVRLWDPASGEQQGAPLLHGAPVLALQPVRDGEYIATLDANGRMRVWDIEARRPLPVEGAAEAPRTASTPAREGRDASGFGTASTRRLADRLPTLAELGPQAIVSFAVDGNGTRIVTARNDGSARSELLPWPLPGILRAVHPYALSWLVLLLALVAVALVAAMRVFSGRSSRIRALGAARIEPPTDSIAAPNVASAQA